MGHQVPYIVTTRDVLPIHTVTWRNKSLILTKPCLSVMLLVSFSLWNETTFCIHCSPVAGLSGWIYILLGISGSALPATIHLLQGEEGGEAGWRGTGGWVGRRGLQHILTKAMLTQCSFGELNGFFLND